MSQGNSQMSNNTNYVKTPPVSTVPVLPVTPPPLLKLGSRSKEDEEKLKSDIDYFADGIDPEEIKEMTFDGSLPPNYYLKVIDLREGLVKITVLKLIKKIFKEDSVNASKYLSPLIAQFVDKKIVYQIFLNSGTDLAMLDNTIYREIRLPRLGTNGKMRSLLVDSLHEAINYLHNKNIVHRDIAHGNIVWNSELNKVFLIDLDNLRELDKDGIYTRNQFAGTYASVNNDKVFSKKRDLSDADIAIKVMDLSKLDEETLNKLYPAGFKVPRHIIRTVFSGTYTGSPEQFEEFIEKYGVYSGGRRRITCKKKKSTRKQSKKQSKKQRQRKN